MSARDFAKIVRATDGRQVLFYVEPEGGDYKLHQIADHGGFLADLTLGFCSPDADENERRARLALGAVTTRSADVVVAEVEKIMGGDA